MGSLLSISLTPARSCINHPSQLGFETNNRQTSHLQQQTYVSHFGPIDCMWQLCSGLQVRFAFIPGPRLKGQWLPRACVSHSRLQEWERASQIMQTHMNPVVTSCAFNIHWPKQSHGQVQSHTTKVVDVKSHPREGERMGRDIPTYHVFTFPIPTDGAF